MTPPADADSEALLPQAEHHTLSGALGSEMEWPWLFLYLSLHTTGCHQILNLYQTPPHIIAVTNNTTEMVCVMKREQLSHLGIYWSRRSKEGQEFQHILYSTALLKQSYGNDINKLRYSVNKESFRNSYTLKISKLQPSDAGIYYCSVSQSSELLIGNGTELSVVDSLPPTEKPTTEKTAPPKKPSRCGAPNRRTVKEKGSSCSGFIWAPLAACAVTLLVLLTIAIRRFQRFRRRMRLYFSKQALR